MDSEINEATAAKHLAPDSGHSGGDCNLEPSIACYVESNGNVNGDGQDELIDFSNDFETEFSDKNGCRFSPEPDQAQQKEYLPREIGLETASPVYEDSLQDHSVGPSHDKMDRVNDQIDLLQEDMPVPNQVQEELIQILGSGDSCRQFCENEKEVHDLDQRPEFREEIPQECEIGKITSDSKDQITVVGQEKAVNGSENSGPKATDSSVAVTKPEAACRNGKEGMNDVECLINTMSAAGLAPAKQPEQQQRASPRIPNGKSKTETGSDVKSAAVVQKNKKGVVNKSKATPTTEPVRQSQEVRTKTTSATANRRSETAGGSPASTSTTRTPRPQTSQRVPVTGPAKVSDSKAKTPAQPAKPKTEQSQSPSTSGSRAASTNLFETSPLVAGIPEELTKLAKTTPSHLIRPTSSIYRPSTSLSPQVKSLAKVSSTSSTTPPSKPAKLAEKCPVSKTSSPKPKTTNSQPIKMGDADGSGEKISTLQNQFAAFSRFGDSASDGKQITLSNCDKWMKQAHVIDGKKITTTDTSILFKKLFKTAKKIGFEDFKKYAEELATSKKIEPKDILEKLANSGAPGTTSATKAAHTGVIERLTDTSKYTGSHKERFDSAGKGRGIEGRRNVQDDSGYVAAFKEKKEEEKRKSETAPAK